MPPKKLPRSRKKSKIKSRAIKKSPRAKTPGPAFTKLASLMARLRAPGGCPWDRQQTHATLKTFLIEETYEVLDALESGDPRELSEELGDLLLQILFHADLALEAGAFDISTRHHRHPRQNDSPPPARLRQRKSRYPRRSPPQLGTPQTTRTPIQIPKRPRTLPTLLPSL